MRATMTTAATATIATAETARSIIPLSSSRRLLVRPHNALRTHARALRPHVSAHLGALPPRACALPAYVCAHAPACSARSCRGPWIATACGRTYRCSLACPLHPLMAPSRPLPAFEEFYASRAQATSVSQGRPSPWPLRSRVLRGPRPAHKRLASPFKPPSIQELRHRSCGRVTPCGRQCNESSENDLGFLEAYVFHLVAIASVPAKSCTGVTPGLAPAQQQNELEGLN
jgi:hypothetical protein